MDATGPAAAIGRARRLAAPDVLGLARAGMWAGALLAPALAWTLLPDGGGRAAPDLVRLLHAMALIKGSLVLAAVVVLHWRLRRPAPAARVAGYLAAAWAMSAMVVAIWRLAHLGLIALAFHATILALAWLAWTDHDFIPDPSRPRLPSVAAP